MRPIMDLLMELGWKSVAPVIGAKLVSFLASLAFAVSVVLWAPAQTQVRSSSSLARSCAGEPKSAHVPHRSSPHDRFRSWR
jgi:hypothetical protein